MGSLKNKWVAALTERTEILEKLETLDNNLWIRNKKVMRRFYEYFDANADFSNDAKLITYAILHVGGYFYYYANKQK